MEYTWWIIGGSGVLGFISFLVSRMVMPCKPCSVSDENAWQNISMTANEDSDDPNAPPFSGQKAAIYEAGTRRIVHVNRPAIVANIKDKKTFPTCVVIGAEGKKSQFHTVIMSGSTSLGFDRDHADANVYLVTYGEIRGYVDPSMEEKFVEPEPRPRRKIWGDIFRPVVKNVPLIGCLLED